MAETYHIYNYRAVDPKTLTVLIQGLGPNTRLGQKIAGINAPLDTILLAVLVDDFNALLNGFAKNPKKVESIAKDLITKKQRFEGFSNPDDLKNKIKQMQEKHRRKNGS